MHQVREFSTFLVNKNARPTAFKVAVVIGSILFIINHGSALAKGQMNRDRWISAGLTYIVPYFVNMHGQFVSRTSKS